MSAVPLTDSVADIRERKEKVVESVKHLGIATLYACLVFVLSMTAFLGSSYFLVPAPEHQSITNNLSNDQHIVIAHLRVNGRLFCNRFLLHTRQDICFTQQNCLVGRHPEPPVNLPI